MRPSDACEPRAAPGTGAGKALRLASPERDTGPRGRLTAQQAPAARCRPADQEAIVAPRPTLSAWAPAAAMRASGPAARLARARVPPQGTRAAVPAHAPNTPLRR